MISFVVLAVVGCAITLTAYRREFVASMTRGATADTLGRVRFLVCMVALFEVLVWEAGFSDIAGLPPGLFALAPDGVVERFVYPLLGWTSYPDSILALQTLRVATGALLVLAALGLGTRIVLPSAAVLYLVFEGIARSYSHLFHTGLVPVYLLLLLAFFPSGDGFAVRTRGTKRAPDAPVYGWCLYLLWVVLSLCYLMAGLNKLRVDGLAWARPSNLRSIVATDGLSPMQFDFDLGLTLLDLPSWVWWSMGIATLVVEVGYPLVLWSQRARLVFPIAAAGLHLSILLFQNILFLDLIVLQLIVCCTARHRSLTGRVDRRADVRSSNALRLVGVGIIALLVCTSVTVWVYDIKYFPFSSFSMYSSADLDGAATYYELRAVDAEGREVELELEEALPVFRDARHRDLLQRTFYDDRDEEMLTGIYRRLASLYTDKTGLGPYSRLVVRRSTWPIEASEIGVRRPLIEKTFDVALDE